MKKPDIQLLQQLFRTATWGNTTETASDWKQLLEGTDENAKKRLFDTLFLELPNPSPLRSLFDEAHIRAYLADYRRPLKRSHLERRRKVWRYVFLGIKEPIPELDWIIRDNK